MIKIDPPIENEFDNFYLAAVSRVDGIGGKRLKMLLDFFQLPKEIWRARPIDLKQAELPQTQIDAFVSYRERFPNSPEMMFEYCNQKNIHLISIRDDIYPKTLTQIKDPPTILFYYGTLLSNEKRLAIVGTRHPSNYGVKAAAELAETLAKNHFTVVSGAAIGIDTVAHTTAMKFGRTIAVLGAGIDSASRHNQMMLQKIAENGAVISEYAPYTKAATGFFPARNRIISGLSAGTIVVEGAETSGAIITADLARAQNRDLFAVPGNIFDSRSKGCHKLIQHGAILISDPQDVIDFYNNSLKLDGLVKISRVEYIEKKSTAKKSEVHLSTDEMVLKTGLDVSKVLRSIGSLEMQDILKSDGNRYSINVDDVSNLNLTEDEKIILSVFKENKSDINLPAETKNKSDIHLSTDEMVLKTGLDVSKVLRSIGSLEMQDILKSDDTGKFILTSNTDVNKLDLNEDAKIILKLFNTKE